MLLRESILRALKNQGKRSLSFETTVRSLKVVFVYLKDGASSISQASFVQKVADALKLEKTEWDLVELSDESLEELSRKTAGWDARTLVLFGESLKKFRLQSSHQKLIHAPSISDLQANPAQKKELWNQLR